MGRRREIYVPPPDPQPDAPYAPLPVQPLQVPHLGGPGQTHERKNRTKRKR